MNTRNVIRVTLALAAAAALAAACGVANPFSPAAASSNRQDELLKWAQCMRQHGVNVPDPVNGQIRITVTPGPGRTAPASNGPVEGNPQFQAAQNACKQYEPNGGNGSGPPSQAEIDQATKFTQCMRDHGIPMQDPKVQGGGIAFQGGGPGAPGIDPNSSQFQQAQQACAKYLPGNGSGKTTTSGGSGSGAGATTGGSR
jgi:hypothetical protein